jgi:hypothetical protein
MVAGRLETHVVDHLNPFAIRIERFHVGRWPVCRLRWRRTFPWR